MPLGRARDGLESLRVRSLAPRPRHFLAPRRVHSPPPAQSQRRSSTRLAHRRADQVSQGRGRGGGGSEPSASRPMHLGPARGLAQRGVRDAAMRDRGQRAVYAGRRLADGRRPMPYGWAVASFHAATRDEGRPRACRVSPRRPIGACRFSPCPADKPRPDLPQQQRVWSSPRLAVPLRGIRSLRPLARRRHRPAPRLRRHRGPGRARRMQLPAACPAPQLEVGCDSDCHAPEASGSCSPRPSQPLSPSRRSCGPHSARVSSPPAPLAGSGVGGDAGQPREVATRIDRLG